MMTRKNGFTLAEVLLAVMIVAIIGLALASLTTAASREATLGNSKIILRNDLSAALRTIRKDMEESVVEADTNELTTHPTTPANQTILRLKTADQSIVYCLEPGENSAAPTGARSGGTIYRLQNQEECATSQYTTENILLRNAKFIPKESTYDYQVPYFKKIGGGAVAIRMIVEAPNSKPVANVATEEVFFPLGVTEE